MQELASLMEDFDALEQSAVDARAVHKEELNMAVAASNKRVAAAEANAQRCFVATNASSEATCVERNVSVECHADDAFAAARRRDSEAVQRIANREVCDTARRCSSAFHGTSDTPFFFVTSVFFPWNVRSMSRTKEGIEQRDAVAAIFRIGAGEGCTCRS